MWSSRRHRPLSLARQFLLLQLVVLGLVLAAVVAITVQQTTQDFRSSRSSRLLAVAENLAGTGVVRSELGTDSTPDRLALQPEIARVSSLSGARVVQIVDLRGRVVASSDPRDMDAVATLRSPVSQGRSWSGDLTVQHRKMVGGQAPVIWAQEGAPPRTVGAVLVLEEYPPWWDRLTDAVPDLLLVLGIAAVLGMAGALVLSRLIRRQTRGLEPAEIAHLADHQEALLTGIHEGVVGVGLDGTVTLANASAHRLLHLPGDPVGRPVQEVVPHAGVADLLLAQGDSESTVIVVDGRALVLNRRRASYEGRSVGTVTTLMDRSDLMSMQSQMSAQASVTDVLRAQTHEFDNRLHTISGLLQLGEYDEAVALIDEVSRRRTRINETVTQRIADPRVAALLVAKITSAAEAGVTLSLEPESTLPRLAPGLSADVGTVLGNLVDNAVDASRANSGLKVSTRVTLSDNVVRVRVADTGAGVDAVDIERIFERGWSTKPSGPAGRGVGLALVQAICSRRGGDVEAANGDHGAVLTARLPVRPGRDVAAADQEHP
ncbi:sensor histidine kinase [Luteipulveratus flavus]|uniref:histidine kinase n=1 Tax=Luteipulveratus flavus TaxID=3031728 RepID=A0ABT6C7G7_9MICO|nr:ATP-binding protein [Luteipulveratus sp. YIM 133296]MDF8264803.1 ATP-binding protein [Luteipulveratus sp. YIM 133296]